MNENNYYGNARGVNLIRVVVLVKTRVGQAGSVVKALYMGRGWWVPLCVNGYSGDVTHWIRQGVDFVK